MKTDLFVIGGFLGSGKTTSILSMAKYLVSCGKKVGIVTNDQGSSLVDTNFLLESGLPVLEVTGGCFCCNFGEFSKKVSELSESLIPDVILAEPVGSCTDLIATIFKPLQDNLTREFSLAPLSILADPKRVRKLMMEDSSPFPSEINYLFKKQLEEADVIVLNKTDTLSTKQVESIVSFLKNKFKGIEVITVSAKEGTGMENWISLISDRVFASKPSLDIDYAAYSKAEECLGWLNGSASIHSEKPHDANQFISELMNGIKNKLKSQSMEIAHLKTYEISEGGFVKASLTGSDDEVDFNRKIEKSVAEANLIVNARVNTNPDVLRAIIERAIEEAAASHNIILKDLLIDCFKPGKPNPTYRIP